MFIIATAYTKSLSMSYRKIHDGGQLLDSSVPREENLPMEEPMTFYSCPSCKSKQIRSCNCQSINYYCNCGWKHINHAHESGSKGRDVNNHAILSKNIRS